MCICIFLFGKKDIVYVLKMDKNKTEWLCPQETLCTTNSCRTGWDQTFDIRSTKYIFLENLRPNIWSKMNQIYICFLENHDNSCRRQDRRALNARYRRTMDRWSSAKSNKFKKKTKFLNLASLIFQETHNLHCWVWNTSARDR